MALNYSELSGSLVITGSVTASLGFSGSFDIDETTINHDNLSGFVGNEHIDHSSVSVTGINGLTGGGDITTSRTITLDGTSTYFTSSVESVMSTRTGSFATTGSNIFSGSQVVTGSLVVTGSVEFTGSLFVSGAFSGSSIYVGGGITAGDDITAFYSSDENLKDNVELIPNAVEKVKQIKGVSFDWNDKSKHNGHDVGVIAQDIEKVLPELVVTRENGFKAVKYDRLVALLIQANKELIERIEKLENK